MADFENMTDSLAKYVKDNRRELGANDQEGSKIRKLVKLVAKNQFTKELNQIFVKNFVEEVKELDGHMMSYIKD